MLTNLPSPNAATEVRLRTHAIDTAGNHYPLKKGRMVHGEPAPPQPHDPLSGAFVAGLTQHRAQPRCHRPSRPQAAVRPVSMRPSAQKVGLATEDRPLKLQNRHQHLASYEQPAPCPTASTELRQRRDHPMPVPRYFQALMRHCCRCFHGRTCQPKCALWPTCVGLIAELSHCPRQSRPGLSLPQQFDLSPRVQWLPLGDWAQAESRGLSEGQSLRHLSLQRPITHDPPRDGK
mmetsp:Transcript_124161/g.247391  ORF Transcript_124161/g.247391 Transcript_124161/m.247391 type:complete len:233 (+) Transcript_124161:227-925(+)